MNGNFLGLGADLAVNASIQVDGSQAAGLLITNGEFTSFHSQDFDPSAVSGLQPCLNKRFSCASQVFLYHTLSLCLFVCVSISLS